ncbi:hypothetical protein NA56DRAFT_718550 [Hyaloscypha hepaticicola]|uniref:Uncharacterized protein n=1 Tax=Hyaloscypha hepaticicola TaxID=2082293 RepID=A0A2J6Q8L8_9HELO|nr:hypothetical protein NA56DRAFT_718550 [Hyaloscypha hepaticicola]
MLVLSLICGHIISGYRSSTKVVPFNHLRDMRTFCRRCIKRPRITRHFFPGLPHITSMFYGLCCFVGHYRQ